jgi:hypothetical protein
MLQTSLRISNVADNETYEPVWKQSLWLVPEQKEANKMHC